MVIVEGNPKDLIWDKYHNPICPHCNMNLHTSNLDMGGNHSYFHICSLRGRPDETMYKYTGRHYDLRKVRDE